MSQPSFCTKCGNQIRPDAKFCPYCGNTLTPLVPSQPLPGATPPPTIGTPTTFPPPYYAQTPWDYEMVKWIDRSKTGLLLLLIGLVIGVIPIIGVLGLILAIIGTILIILGRKAFGDKHSQYVLISVGVYIFGFIIVFFASLSFAFTVVTAASNTTLDRASLTQILNSATNTLLIGAIIGASITAFAYVLVTYAIQNKIGTILLWAAYGITLAFEVAIYFVLEPQIAGAINASLAAGNTAPLEALRGQISYYGILNLIPYGLYAAAYYLVWSRINRGELPPRSTPQQPMPPTVPPTM